jgi:methylated-DNA-[protein]-cysteine S-methyltransferase
MTGPLYYQVHPSPIGELLLTSEGETLTGLFMERSSHPPRRGPSWVRDDEPFREVRDQLDEYFAGDRTAFDLPVAPRGTPFQQRVWAALREIPYGRTASYSEIARRLGSPRAVRAVGGANGRNPISIVIPCHRVISADGSLGGYGGGLGRKEFLLAHERSHRPGAVHPTP